MAKHFTRNRGDEMAVQFEQLDLSGYAKINDTTPSASTTYSSQKIEEILPETGAIIDDSEASTTKTYSSTHIDETYLKKDGNGSGVSVEYKASDTGSAPASGSTLGNLIGWIVGKCNGIGNISNLLTVAKSNLVAAINELRVEIGDLTQLETTEKTDLVAAINKLNSKTEFEDLTLDISKSGWKTGHCTLKAQNGVLYMDYYIHHGSDAQGSLNYDVGTIPDGYRPQRSYDIRSAAWCSDVNGQRYGANVRINAQGVVSFIGGGTFREAGFSFAIPI